MKKLMSVLVFLSSFLLQAQAAGNGTTLVPTLEVSKAFEKDFPKVKPIWRKEFNGEDKDQLSYEADFVLAGSNMTAVYNALGTFKVLQVEIQPADLPVEIRNYMARNYPKNNIRKAAKLITNDNKITYEIGITINGKWVDAIFNKEGDFLMMVPKS